MNDIEFYFDFSSPYGYFGSTRIDEIAGKHGRSVDWRPYLVGTAMKQTGHQPLYNTPMFHDYVVVDVPRFARLLGVPFQLPESFPLVASAACRGYYWLYQQDAETAKQFARAVYRAFFGDGRDISRVEELEKIASELGMNGPELGAATRNPGVKELFKERNNAALARGVFGSPFIIVDGEPFWGADRLDQVDQWLATGGW